MGNSVSGSNPRSAAPASDPRVVVFVLRRVAGGGEDVASIAEDVRAAFESGASRQSGVKVEDVCVGGTGRWRATATCCA